MVSPQYPSHDPEFLALLETFLEDQLSRKEKQALERHLKRSPEAREHFAETLANQTMDEMRRSRASGVAS